MTDLAACHAAVIAAPEDDVPRAAYAAAIALTDWQRAELVSLQLRLAFAEAPDAAAEARCAALVDERGAEWAALVAPLVAAYRFARGFVDEVTLPGRAFAARAAVLYEVAPILRVRLTGDVPLEALVSPHLTRLRGLDLRDAILDDRARAAITARALPKLRSLQLPTSAGA